MIWNVIRHDLYEERRIDKMIDPNCYKNNADNNAVDERRNDIGIFLMLVYNNDSRIILL